MGRKAKHNSKFLVVGVVCCIAVGALLYFHSVSATPYTVDDVGGSVGLTSTDLKTIVINVIKWILGILALVAVVLIIYGGIIWMTAAGSAEKIEKAKRIIIDAVIGLVVVLISWAIVVFVVQKILGASGGGGPATPGYCVTYPMDPLCVGSGTIGLEIRSITTSCENAPVDYRHGVSLCSGVNITFNHILNGQTVVDAVGNGSLKIEQCTSVDAQENCIDAGIIATADGSVLDGFPGNPANNLQRFVSSISTTFTNDLKEGAAWAAKPPLENTGKNITFFHVPTLYDINTWYRVTIPKSISDLNNDGISGCRSSNSALTDLDGCVDHGVDGYYTWTMQTGEDIDTDRPVVASSYPSSAYLVPESTARPDRSVPRTPLINVRYNEAVLLPTSVVLTAYESAATPDPTTGLGGTLIATPVDPATYTVTPGDDGTSFILKMNGANKLDEYTWYKIVVNGVMDLCNNTQNPDPFEWVFETNDVVPGIAGEYPKNGYENSCPSTPVFLKYTVSMYDPDNSSCELDPGPGSTQGYVMSPYFFLSDTGLPDTGRSLSVEDACPGTCLEPQDYCKVYSFTGPDLRPNTPFTVGIDNRYPLDDQGTTLQFGTIPAGTPLAPWTGDSVNGAWTFNVKEPGECADPPVITSIQPPRGTDGQCVTVNGYNFDPNGDLQANGDDLFYDGATFGAENILSWSNQQIPATIPDTGPDDVGVPVSVTAQFGVPFGLLSSEPVLWNKESGDPSNGPCLSSLEPNNGLVASTFTAKGKRINASSTIKQVNFGALVATYLNWGDDAVTGISVPNVVPLSYPVSVTNDAGTSNSLNFTVNPIPPDQPIVIDHQPPSCMESCIDADINATFSKDIDPTTLTADTIKVKRCNDQDCDSFGADINIILNVTSATKVYMEQNPVGQITAGTWYRVVLTNGIKGSTAPADGFLGGLNYRDADDAGPNDAYSWIFRTAALGASGCTLDNVKVFPSNFTMHTDNEQKAYLAEAWTAPNSCSAQGQELTTTTTWSNWSTPVHDPVYATVAVGDPLWTATVTALEQTYPDATTVDVEATRDSVLRLGSATLMIDFAYCTDDAGCQLDGCTDSICNLITHRCTPDITSFGPSPGAVGTWVGIDGCYFDNYRRGICVDENVGVACDSDNDCGAAGHCNGGSAIIFTDARRNTWPNTALCGPASSNWLTTHVRAEVPNKLRPGEQAADGQITLQRWDGETAQSSTDFDVDPLVVRPGICKLDPNMGSETMNVRILGQNFGDDQGTSRVLYYGLPGGVPGTIDANTTAWSDTEIMSIAPQGIADNDPLNNYEYPVGNNWGGNEVAVQNGVPILSNVEAFIVRPPGCAACLDDSMCNTVPDQACGYNGCCAARPHLVLPTSPPDDATDVCRNSLISASFDRAMSAASITQYNVHFSKYTQNVEHPTEWENIEVEGVKISYSETAVEEEEPERKMTIDAGLLDRNALFTVALGSPTNIAPNGSFEISTDGILPDDWAFNSEGTSLTNDVPPGVTGTRSVKVESSIPNQQAWAAKNIGISSKLRRTYHITGWVKYQKIDPLIPNSIWNRAGGLIPRCWGDGYDACYNYATPGFDLRGTDSVENRVPGFLGGLFSYSSIQDTWLPIDLTVTNNTGLSTGLSIDCFANYNARIWCDDIRVTEITSPGVKSVEGASLLTTEWSFTTADMDGPCLVSRVGVKPSTWTFYTSDTVKPESRKQFTATAYSDTGTVLSKIPGLLDWNWGWSRNTGDYITVLPPTNTDTVTVQALPAKGRTTLIASVKPITKTCSGTTTPCVNATTCGGVACVAHDPIGQTTVVKGTASINNISCEDPWMPQLDGQYGYIDNDTNCSLATTPPGTCRNYHFEMGYCKEGGLPDLTATAITQYAAGGGAPMLLKEFLFKENNPDTKDAIGIRIYDNIEGLSAAEWYLANAKNPKKATLPQTVDGYDAIRDGTAVYVGASDFDGTNFSSKIFIVSYTAGADAKVVSIFNQMLESWFFNNNVNGACNPSAPDDQIVSNKVCVQRDLKRIAGLSDIVQYLRAYRTANGSYPKLEAGSYIAQLSFSAWPSSWQQTLGTALKQTLPVDPINKIENCPTSQSQDGTCWSEVAKTFICTNDPIDTADPYPKASHVYGYTSKTCTGGTNDGSACMLAEQCLGGVCEIGARAKLYANLEYMGPGSWINNPTDLSTLCPAGSDCSCFNYTFGP